MAESEGFIKYIETSSLLGEGVKNVFDEMIQAILKDQARYQKDILAGLNTPGKDKQKKGGGSSNEGEKKCIIM